VIELRLLSAIFALQHASEQADRDRAVGGEAWPRPREEWLLLDFLADTVGHMQLTGLFELKLESEGIPLLVTAEIMPPGVEEAEVEAKVVAEWILHFGISEPIALEALKCVSMRPLAAKPADALSVPKGTLPILIWKSEEV